MDITRTITKDSYGPGPRWAGQVLKASQDMLEPSGPSEPPSGLKGPSVNLLRARDFTAENLLVLLNFSQGTLDLALGFLIDLVRLDNLQILHSFPQKWPLSKKADHCSWISVMQSHRNGMPAMNK